MAIIEGIAGNTYFKNRGAQERVRLPRREGIFPIRLERLQEADLPAFQKLMVDGMTSTPTKHIPQADQDAHVAKRTLEYYEGLFKQPEQNPLFVAKDQNGKIVGGIEGDRFDVEGYNLAYINWVTVDAGQRGAQIALDLYKAMEDWAIGKGDITFLMANVHRTNTPSLRLHEKVGFNRGQPYLRKPERAPGDWYYKQIKTLPEEAQLPIIETDYLPSAAVTAVKTAEVVMKERGLGEIELIDGAKQRDNESLVRIVSPNDKTRRIFERVFTTAVEVINGDVDQNDPKTTTKIQEKVTQAADFYISK